MRDTKRWLREKLSRSAATPLDVQANLRSCGDQLPQVTRNIAVAIRSFSRIRCLTLLADQATLLEVLPLFSWCAPHLESLQLINDGHIHDEDTSDVIELPTGLLTMDAPCLRRVKLEGFHVDWSAFAFRTLTELSITCVSPTAKPTSSQLSAVLARLPLLRNLALIHVVSNIAPAPFSEKHVLAFNHLKHLELQGDYVDCVNFLSGLVAPPNAIRDFTFDGGVDRGATFPPRDHDIPSSHRLDGTLAFLLGLGSDNRMSSPCLRLSLFWGSAMMASLMPFLSRLCCALPTSGVEHLQITVEPSVEVPPVIWEELAGAYTAVRQLEFFDTAPASLLALLFENTQQVHDQVAIARTTHDNDLPNVRLLFPALESVKGYGSAEELDQIQKLMSLRLPVMLGKGKHELTECSEGLWHARKASAQAELDELD
ncbi:hypothetical protein BV22DRAFT_1134030 [Leucogyrophana mollusca]|uniref:Uncharacterized protein n=1 Tax=Leucogyrophana mollusca TaxID=85980 RepID=A0ACB8B1A3_9AGAM|nr:hypothetical protein BV22DRAFT_1134030 [Leucogyrophana mollusca]